MKNLAPEIFRKRLLIEGCFSIDVDESAIRRFFTLLTDSLKLKTYGKPIVHHTGGVGKEENQGYDAFVPLIDSGIYLAIWTNQKFFSLVIYTCKDFDDAQAVDTAKLFFESKEVAHSGF